MDKNTICIDPNIDDSVKAYLGSKQVGDMVDLRLRGTVASIEDDQVIINIEEVVRLPEWKTGDDETEGESSPDNKEDGKEDGEGDNAVVLVMGGAPSSKKKKSFQTEE